MLITKKMVCFNNFLVGIFFVSIDGSRDASSTPIFLPDVRGESFFVFFLESVNFISRLLLLFHLECDQRLIEIEARFLYIFIISPLVDIITTGGFYLKMFFSGDYFLHVTI